MEHWKRSGQIPEFGNWDYANELPITQYFETARQAGLIRYGSSSSETDLYTVELKKPVRKATRRSRETGMRKHGKVFDVTEYPKKQTMNKNMVNDVVLPSTRKLPKPVDEDLYKISPHLVPTTKRKKMLGFITMCLVPAACVS